jgi:hypothetical protein
VCWDNTAEDGAQYYIVSLTIREPQSVTMCSRNDEVLGKQQVVQLSFDLRWPWCSDIGSCPVFSADNEANRFGTRRIYLPVQTLLPYLPAIDHAQIDQSRHRRYFLCLDHHLCPELSAGQLADLHRKCLEPFSANESWRIYMQQLRQ